MKVKALAAGLALAGLAASSHAVSYTASLSSGSVSFGRSDITEAAFTDRVYFTGLGDGEYFFEASIVSYDGVAFSTAELGGTDFGIFNFGGLSVGFGKGEANTWLLTIEATGDGFASYGGQISVTPVPEPETYALMLAGLGAMGFIAMRRRRD